MRANQWIAILVCASVSLGIAPQAHAGCPRDDLRLNEVCFLPAVGQHQWVEVSNIGDAPVEAGGVEVLSNGGSYSLPGDLEAIPKDGIVVVHFDGAGAAANDYSFAGDNKAELHTEAGTVDVLGSPAGYCSLYRVTGAHSKETLLDFVAWGDAPGEAADEAVGKRIWASGNVHLWTDPANPPVGPGGWSVTEGDAIARDVSGRWTYSPAAKGTKGDGLLPSPEPIFPNEGAKILNSPARCTFSEVPDAQEFQVQIALDPDFDNVVRTIVSLDAKVGASIQPPLERHKVYWWRVRSVGAAGATSAWSQTRSFTVGHPPPPRPEQKKTSKTTKNGDSYSVSGAVLDSGTGMGLPGCNVGIDGKLEVTDAWGEYTISDLAPGSYSINVTREHYTFPTPDPTITIIDANITAPDISGTGESHSLAVTPLAARKDTTMLAITPGAVSQVMCNRDNSSNQAWDRPLPRPTHSGDDLESWWCWAVGATMINRYYGGSINRDEVVNEVKGDILHDDDAGAGVAECKESLRYALDTDNAHIEDLGRKPTSDEIKAWLDADRPIYTSQPGHIMVIRAYKYENGDFYAEHLNTDNNAAVEWREWSGVNLHGGSLCWAPTAGLTGIDSDPRVSSDSDGDGVCDFDEEERFVAGEFFPRTFLFWGGRSLNASASDTDDDGVDDKNEIASYVFPRGAPNGGNISGVASTDPDPDNDKYYPPTDEDSDDGGIEDGEEDTDADGRFDADEGDVFDLNDDGSLDLIFCIDTTGSMGDDIDAVKAQAVDIVNQIAEDFPNFRVAVVDYRDHPVSPYGEPGTDYAYNDVLAFSTDKSAIVSAINSLSLGNGRDTEESVYSGIMHCIDASTLGGWREDPVTRKIIVMGDAPPHDPEPFTGYTLASVEAAASVGGTVWEYGYTKGDETKGDGDDLSGPISGISIVTSGSLPSFEDIAEVMDGLYLEAGGAGDVPDAVRDALDAIKTDPIVSLEVQGELGDTNIIADASKTVDPKCCGILMYEWDWEADGTYDEWSYSPMATHAYPGGFGGRVRVRATSVTGEEGTDTFIILIPEFLDVTEYTDTAALASHLNRDTGAIVCDLEIGNKTDTIKTLKDKFYFCLPPTADLFLANADGTLEDGTPYVDVTDLVESALPTVGDGDLELDPGETVWLEDAIEIYSRDRSMPTGFVFAVWADPPPSVAPVHYPTKLGHPKDVNDDFVIDDFEILEAVDHWSGGQVDDFGLLEAIELWRAGGYEWDEAQGKFVPKE